VQIDLIVRGLSILRPGVKGLSDNIRVRSIVGRFLEHSRIYHFATVAKAKSISVRPDWMPRNLFERCEVVFPVRDPAALDRIHTEILARTDGRHDQGPPAAAGRHLRPRQQVSRMCRPFPVRTSSFNWRKGKSIARRFQAQLSMSKPFLSARRERWCQPVAVPHAKGKVRSRTAAKKATAAG